MIQQYKISLLTLLLLASFASFGAVVFAPALPDIARYFAVSPGVAEITMSIYLLGYACGQLLYGPLSSRYGRKTALLIGITIALLGGCVAIVAAVFHNFIFFIVARLINAMGASAGLVISMIIIKDVHDETNARRTFSKVILAFAFVPFVAIALGGVLTERLGWQSINVVIIIYSILVLIAMLYLPETHSKEKRISLSISYLLNSYKELLSNLSYLRLVLLFTISGAVNYVFNAIAPIVIIKNMHISAEFYGWLSIIPSAGILLGGWASSHFAQRIKASQMIFLGINLCLISGLVLALLFAGNMFNLFNIYVTALILFFGTSLIIPNASMQAISQIKDHANGTSVMNAIALALNSMCVSVTGSFIGFSILALPMAIIVLSLAGMMLQKVSISAEQPI